MMHEELGDAFGKTVSKLTMAAWIQLWSAMLFALSAWLLFLSHHALAAALNGAGSLVFLCCAAWSRRSARRLAALTATATLPGSSEP